MNLQSIQQFCRTLISLEVVKKLSAGFFIYLPFLFTAYEKNISGDLPGCINQYTILAVSTSTLFAQDLKYYLPDSVTYNPSIPKPKDIIFHEVSKWDVLRTTGWQIIRASLPWQHQAIEESLAMLNFKFAKDNEQTLFFEKTVRLYFYVPKPGGTQTNKRLSIGKPSFFPVIKTY